MSNYKKLIRVCYIVGLILLIWNTISFIMTFFEDVTALEIVLGSMDIFSTLFSSIVFGVYNTHDENYARKHKGLLITACCFAFWGSILIGILAIIAIYDLNNSRAVAVENNPQSPNVEGEKKTEEDKNEEVADEKGEISIEEVKEEEPLADMLIKKIKALDEMKKEGTISDEEYEILKKKILEEIIR